MDKNQVIREIKYFLDGHNDELKYIVNVETDKNSNVAKCMVHPPNEEKYILDVKYKPFLYVKDLKKNGYNLFSGDKQFMKEMMKLFGIEITKLETGNQKKLEEGYCYKVSSTESFNSIIKFFKEGKLDMYEKLTDEVSGKEIKNYNGDPVLKNRDLFYYVRPEEQFFIDKGVRLFKGIEEYRGVHRVIFDIETTGLRPEISRVFSIGITDNRGFRKALIVDKVNDDEAEVKLIQDFFLTVIDLYPAVVAGYNSEDFDFPYLLKRLELLGVDYRKMDTTIKKDVSIRRNKYGRVKIGGASEKYVATELWGMSVIDIMFAAKRTAKINSDIKETNLKYIAKFENVAKEDRTYIKGDDNGIGRYFHENPIFIANDVNEHIEIPSKHQKTANLLFNLQEKKDKLKTEDYNAVKKLILDENDTNFIDWYKKEALPKNMNIFVQGKKLVEKYLLDDLHETIEIDEIYNQSSFMLTKIVPTTFTRICTMGTASIWNLLLTAWSYEKNLAIPIPDKKKKFTGGLSRCYKIGYVNRLVKIDYASLYPMLQLTWDIFPIFDISSVMKKMLIYMTTTRNIYKKLANADDLNDEELTLVKEIDHESQVKYENNLLTNKDRSLFAVKQLPIKTLNNSQFGALGGDVAFKWSDNECAERITTCGRLELRHAIKWFSEFNCTPLYAVTDGVNFQIPNRTTIKVDSDGKITHNSEEGLIEDMWQYGDKVGINALIKLFNDTEMVGFMSVDNDGEFISCYNLARINYATLGEKKNKETGEIKRKIRFTGNTIKSSVLADYIDEFYQKGFELILEGKGYEFVKYYQDYVEQIYYKKIPLRKIATKKRYKNSIKDYLKRGTDINGKDKAKQAHMELIIQERKEIAEKIFQERKNELNLTKPEDELTIEDKLLLVDVYMPPEPELDSTLYYYNTGYRKSHGDSGEIKDKDTGELRPTAKLINKEDLMNNPDMTGEYNVDKYLAAFNKRVSEGMLIGFDEEVAKRIIAKIKRTKVLNKKTGKKEEKEELVISEFTRSELELRSFDLDDLDESMYLEENEVKFWNSVGFDPRKVWNGFKMYDDNKVHFEIYENALKFSRNNIDPNIKSQNDEILSGDKVLFKRGSTYSLGYHNGEYVEIIDSDVNVPKSDVELEMDRINEEKQKDVDKLQGVDFDDDSEKRLNEAKERREEYFDLFREKFGIEEKTFQEFMIKTEGQGGEIVDSFIVEHNKKIEAESSEYLSDL